MIIPNLPFEIIEQTNRYLTQEDRYNLVLTGQAFYQLFTRLLYRSITIETHKQWARLISNFENSHQLLPLGHYVHSLSILLDKLPETELRRIQNLCPFVQSIHIDWRIWNYQSFVEENKVSDMNSYNYQPRKLTNFAYQFMTHYGPCKLSSLVLDVSHMTSINPANILSYTPHLKSLQLVGINQEITFNCPFIERLHELCPNLELLHLDGCLAEADTHNLQSFSIQPSNRMKSFHLKAEFGADHFQDWLPYIALKYPQLEYLEFHHSGESKDMIELGTPELYCQFFQRCPQLAHFAWHNAAPDFQFLKEINRPIQTLSILDTLPLSSLLTSSLFNTNNQHMQSVSRLEIGPLPRDITPNDLIHSIGHACPHLKHLALREMRCNLSQPFKIDVILNHCPALLTLSLVRIALRVSFPPSYTNEHPLQVLEMQHCSSFDGMFEHVSICCPQLRELQLFAVTQRDRRYKVQIHLPRQQLRKIKLHGLRTETFDEHRRIRFFCINTKGVVKWYYMDKYSVENDMEVNEKMILLNETEVSLLHVFMRCKTNHDKMECIKQHLRSYPDSIAKNWYILDEAGYVDIHCDSVRNLNINKKLIEDIG